MFESTDNKILLIKESYDVLIMGGGLAGLTLALQLRKNMADASIAVIEKNRHPVPEAAFKVGESSVEIGSRYFQHILGLQTLLDDQLPKLGLRFFYTLNDNADITERVELGTSDFPPVPSFQIDRGRFENGLAEECLKLDIDFIDDSRISDISLSKHNHSINLQRHNKSYAVSAKWLVDATGRNSLLKRKLKLNKSSKHDVNAAWFRINKEINIDDWNSNNTSWQERVNVSRRLSTNHLFGSGYWVWLIPLASGATSIGIVADAKLHPFAEFNTFERAMTWLSEHEPQCYSVIESQQDYVLDFKSLKHYAHGCRQMYSDQGWGITGDSGMFVDPFYSPGSDFIAIGNGFLCDVISKHLAGQPISSEVMQYEKMFRIIYLAFLPIYQDQYFIMGNAKIMSTKIIWDYCVYWGSIALLFFNNKLCDLSFMTTGMRYLEKFYHLNIDMQLFFHEWAVVDKNLPNLKGTFINYTKMPFLQSLSKSLIDPKNDEELCTELTSNIVLLEQIAYEIINKATNEAAELKKSAPAVGPSESDYLAEMFSLFDSEK